MFSPNTQINHLICDIIKKTFLSNNQRFLEILLWLYHTLNKINTKAPSDFLAKSSAYFKMDYLFAEHLSQPGTKKKMGFLDKQELKSSFKKAIKTQQWEITKMKDNDYNFLYDTLNAYIETFIELNEYIFELENKPKKTN